MFTGKQLREARKAAGFRSVSEFAEYLGVNKDNVYKWERGTRPNGEDYQKVENFLNRKMENVPHRTTRSGEMEKNSTQETERQQLLDMNSKMAEAMLIDARSRDKDATSRQQLTEINAQLSKKIIERADQGSLLDVETRIGVLQELLAEVASGKKFGSRREAIAAFRTRLYGDQKNKQQQTDIHDD